MITPTNRMSNAAMRRSRWRHALTPILCCAACASQAAGAGSGPVVTSRPVTLLFDPGPPLAARPVTLIREPPPVVRANRTITLIREQPPVLIAIRTPTILYRCAGADLNGDNAVDSDDLGLLLSGFSSKGDLSSDVNADGFTNSDDLGILLSSFGSMCP
ncbi:MAG: hypothetical protein ACTS3F_14585 [Phycisphaerales bacterium]